MTGRSLLPRGSGPVLGEGLAGASPEQTRPAEAKGTALTYEEMCQFETLYKAYLTARKGKRNKAGTAQYEANALACTEKLSRLLLSKTYRPSKFEIFKVYEPKERDVQAPAFVDKVVLHAATDNILYDAITKGFIRDNYSSQKGKGTHDGLMRLKLQMVTYFRRYGTTEGIVVKGDIRHFFASIDHRKLKRALKRLFIRRGLDMELYDLLCIYIDASDGLPLGYQTSQLFALLFLDEFDHWIKEEKGCEFYGRYMDDFYIIVRTKEEARRLLAEIREFIADLGLELNQKTGIFPLRNGIDLLGFHSYLTESGGVVQKLRKDGIERIQSRIRYWRKAYHAGEITKEKIIDQFQGWDAHAAHGDTYALLQRYARQVGEIIGEVPEIHRKINSTKEVRARRRAKQERCIRKKTGAPVSFALPALEGPRPDDIPPWM